MPGKKIYFASDFHLGARYIENPIEYERRIVRWLDSIKQDAGTLYLLGDILDYWYEYRYVVPKGFTRFFGKLAELSDNDIDIHWFIGNHDIWIFDYLPHELGITIHDGTLITEIGGKRFFLSHGDNVGKRPMTLRFLRKIFRNRFCQYLYAAIHPGGPLLLHCDGRPIVERPEMTTPNIKARKTSTWYALPKNLGKRIKSIFSYSVIDISCSILHSPIRVASLF